MVKNPRKIGIVAQDNIFWEDLTVHQNMIIIGELSGLKNELLYVKIELLYAALDLKHIKDIKAKYLSGG